MQNMGSGYTQYISTAYSEFRYSQIAIRSKKELRKAAAQNMC